MSRTPVEITAVRFEASCNELLQLPDQLEHEHGPDKVKLRLRLNLLPAMAQFALDSGTGIEEHVAWQSLERLLLQAFGHERLLPPATYANLVAFERVQYALFHAGCTHLMHGQGFQANLAQSGAMDGADGAAGEGGMSMLDEARELSVALRFGLSLREPHVEHRHAARDEPPASVT